MRLRRLVPGRIRQWLRGSGEDRSQLPRIEARLDAVAQAIGRMEARQTSEARSLPAAEFSVYSHAGEDGILAYLTRVVPLPNHIFVEFGVEDYQEANTRLLLVNDYWSGLVMDGSPKHVARIRGESLSWNRDLKALAAFVTRENVNELIASQGIKGPIGLLVIDVDGNDYWILEALDVVEPAILVMEYNHRFGPTDRVVAPYDPTFVRRQTDASWLFNGASLAAIVRLAERKGYAFVGCARFGNNAFFVQRDRLPAGLPALTAEEGFVAGSFREAMLMGEVVRVPTPEELAVLRAGVELVEVE